MNKFKTTNLPQHPDTIAPDGSEIRLLLGVNGGGLAHFQLPAGQISKAVIHKTVEEVWYVLSGKGEMWRANDEQEEVVLLEEGVSLTIPLGTKFQFRASDDGPLSAIGMTTPPWPGEDEAAFAEGKWDPKLTR